MKKYKTTIIALLALVVVAAVFVTVTVLQKKKPGDDPGNNGENSNYVALFSLVSRDIIGFETKYNETYTVVKYDADGSAAWKCTWNMSWSWR